MWFVVMKRMRWDVEEATPSSALRRPEKVTLPLNLCIGSVWKEGKGGRRRTLDLRTAFDR